MRKETNGTKKGGENQKSARKDFDKPAKPTRDKKANFKSQPTKKTALSGAVKYPREKAQDKSERLDTQKNVIECEVFDNSTVESIQQILGYKFLDRRLLERAFTHGSKDQSATKNYQSLEFLGDSILDFIVAKRLMEINPDAHEGALTRLRAQIVSKEPLAEEVGKLGLEKYLIVGKGENAKAISNGQKTMSDIFEAVIAAIYLDSKSIDVAESFILSKLADLFNGKGKHVGVDDYKSKLNEFASRNDVAVSYEELRRTGPAHNPTFVVEVKVNTFVAGVGEGKSKREAEQLAAKQALEKIK